MSYRARPSRLPGLKRVTKKEYDKYRKYHEQIETVREKMNRPNGPGNKSRKPTYDLDKADLSVLQTHKQED